MYVRKQPWCVYLVSNYLLTFQRTSEGILCDKKINLFTFYAEKSAHLQPQNKKHPHFLCRFIKASMRRKNISSYFFCRSTGSLHICDEGFFNTPSLLQRNSEALLPPKFLTFYKLFTNEEKNTSHFYCRFRSALSEYFFAFLLLFQPKKKAPHFPWDFRSTLNTQNSHLLHFVYILSPFLKQNDIFQTLISFFEQQKIRLGFLRFLIGFSLFNRHLLPCYANTHRCSDCIGLHGYLGSPNTHRYWDCFDLRSDQAAFVCAYVLIRRVHHFPW